MKSSTQIFNEMDAKSGHLHRLLDQQYVAIEKF